MFKFLSYIFLISVLNIIGTVNSQFPFFGNQQQQQQPQQQNNPYNFFGSFNFPQQNPQYNPQALYYPQSLQNNQNVNQSPNRASNYQTRPPIYTQPTAAPHFNQRDQIDVQYSTRNPRISQLKCKEYAKVTQSSSLGGSLSLISDVQPINTDNCDNSQGLVIGGENAKAGEFPHMAAIGYRNLDNIVNYKCGGSLISEQYVLTAAHCSSSRLKPSVVRLGDLGLYTKENYLDEIDVPIESFISHEQFSPKTKKNDIALIRLSRSVSFTNYIRPACLPSKPNQNRKVIATGWGLTKFNDKSSGADILQKVELNMFQNSLCNDKLFGTEISLDNSQICAGELSGGKDTCQGDSGGPLQVSSEANKCSYEIIGITSYGVSCGEENSPGIYTNIYHYLDWIEKKVWG